MLEDIDGMFHGMIEATTSSFDEYDLGSITEQYRCIGDIVRQMDNFNFAFKSRVIDIFDEVQQQ